MPNYLPIRTVLIAVTMTLDHQDQTDLDAPPSPCRDKTLIHTPSDPPQCDACHRLELSFFDPNCKECMTILSEPSTPVSKVFAVLRQWTSRTQQILELLVREILKRGVHVNDRDGLTDMTLLHYVCKAAAMGMGDIDEACRMVHLLMSHGADPFIRCRWTNMAAIHYATYFNVAPVLKILLDTTQSIDVDSKCSEFDMGSPLHIACTHQCLDVTEVLLQHGANVKEKDGLGRIPRECIPDETEGRNVRELHKLLDEAEPKETAVPMLHYDDIGGKVTLQSLGMDIGEKVIVGGVKSGTLRFCGPTEFASGMWAGIELDEAAGKNDGSIQGISYFQCPPMHGIFAPMSKITKPGMVTSTPIKADRRTSPPKVSPPHKKLDTSRVTAKVDTGLGRSPLKSFPTLDPGDLQDGDRVIVAGQREGVVRFSGETKFAPGWWYGIDLDRAVGKNDGAVNGERYFTCKAKHGVFAPPSRVTKVDESGESSASLDSLATADKQRRLSGGSTGLPSIYTMPTRSRQKRPRSSGNLGLMKRTQSANGELKLQEKMSVFCNNELGTVKYIGPTEFAEGTWVGVELRTPKGKNDGSVQGKRYFSCKPNYGLIVRPSKVTVRGINGAKLLEQSHV